MKGHEGVLNETRSTTVTTRELRSVPLCCDHTTTRQVPATRLLSLSLTIQSRWRRKMSVRYRPDTHLSSSITNFLTTSAFTLYRDNYSLVLYVNAWGVVWNSFEVASVFLFIWRPFFRGPKFFLKRLPSFCFSRDHFSANFLLGNFFFYGTCFPGIFFSGDLIRGLFFAYHIPCRKIWSAQARKMLAANVGYRYWTDDRSRLGW